MKAVVRNYVGAERVVTIDRLTKTQAVSGSVRYRLADGSRMGGHSLMDRAWLQFDHADTSPEVRQAHEAAEAAEVAKKEARNEQWRAQFQRERDAAEARREREEAERLVVKSALRWARFDAGGMDLDAAPQSLRDLLTACRALEAATGGEEEG